VKANKDEVAINDNTSEVTPSINALVAKLETMNNTLFSQDKLLKRTSRERKEFKNKLEIELKELEEAKKLVVVVSDKVECDECVIHMSNLNDLQSKYVALLDKNDELKSRSGLLGACKSCSGLQSELTKKVARISLLEKASSDSTTARCARCEDLELEIKSCSHDKMRIEEGNTNLRSILRWVSCSEPQLGMMMSQFKQGTSASGVGFVVGGKGENLYGKVGEYSGLKPSEKPTTTPKLIKITPPEPTLPTTKDGVFEEPPKAPP
jgi:hypothetical protein